MWNYCLLCQFWGLFYQTLIFAYLTKKLIIAKFDKQYYNCYVIWQKFSNLYLCFWNFIFSFKKYKSKTEWYNSISDLPLILWRMHLHTLWFMYFKIATASYNFYLFLQLTRAINIIAKYLLHIDFNVIHNNYYWQHDKRRKLDLNNNHFFVNVGTTHLVSLIFLQYNF